MLENRSFSLSVESLYDLEQLCKLDLGFLQHLAEQHSELVDALIEAREEPHAVSPADETVLILALAPYLETYLARCFGLQNEVVQLQQDHLAYQKRYTFKKNFIQRRAARLAEPQNLVGTRLAEELAQAFGGPFDETIYYEKVSKWLEDENLHSERIEKALYYAAWAILTEEGRHLHRHGTLFKLPRKHEDDFKLHAWKRTQALSDLAVYESSVPETQRPIREGFKLTDPGLNRDQSLDQAHYCIHCHARDKDSCSTGLRSKQTETFEVNSDGIALEGCPLEEKISQAHLLKTRGLNIAALATIIIDNPMVAATGHRICNDCMKACIYQKQEPVNIPGVETQILHDVLDLDWGFEIYSLLTRWNPLNIRHPLPKASSGYKVLIAGMGPAGFTLAHYLLNEGHQVVGIDGLKIEPLPHHLSGVARDGQHVPFQLIKNISEIWQSLDQRISGGFGGVAEYGITVRWDKNFLMLIQLLLLRRSSFALFDGIRLGSTLTLEQAFDLGFDHVALCLGAGQPKWIPMPGGLTKGVRVASDFLMALQLTGAARSDSIANLQVRMPIVVIGGGLTAIDTATEALAYYPLQIKKFAQRYDELLNSIGENELRRRWTPEDLAIADEMLEHAAQLKTEEDLALQEQRQPQLHRLLKTWGGATIVYRKDIRRSPSYTHNHEEVDRALEEGLQFLDYATPLEVAKDTFGYAASLKISVETQDAVSGQSSSKIVSLPARTILMAAGTQPNTLIAAENPQSGLRFSSLTPEFFSSLHEDTQHESPHDYSPKQGPQHVLAHVRPDGRAISFFGDLHPSFAGNVVKAMASAKFGYPQVTRAMLSHPPVLAPALLPTLHSGLRAKVHSVQRLTPTILEVLIHAPFAAQAFQPGQFYRLQNYEVDALKNEKTTLAVEALAMTGARVEVENGLISVIILEMGGSSSLCRSFKSGDPVVLMGPTGMPTHLSQNKTILLLGGGLGNAVLFSIGQALRKLGNRVLYFAGYKTPNDVFHQDQLENAADQVVWCCDVEPGIPARRTQDLSFVGNIIQAVTAYAQQRAPFEKESQSISMSEIDHMIVIGSDRMMAAVAKARTEIWADLLIKKPTAVGSINSPMQCMMKEICGQCLQRHVDPITGHESVVFSCVNQDQPLELVDFSCLRDRLEQNSTQERITALWIEHSVKLMGPHQSHTRDSCSTERN